MRALIQRVKQASVSVGEETVGSIGSGLVVFIGIRKGDTEQDAEYLVKKTVNLRIFPDTEERFSYSALEIEAQLLVVSQFTLYADTSKGRRPSFISAAPAEEARSLFQMTLALFRNSGLKVESGRFQEHMMVEIHNDGPVTLMLDSQNQNPPQRSSIPTQS